MEEPKNGFTATPFSFNGISGYMLRQYVSGVLRVEQFIHDLPKWCNAANVPLSSIAIVD